MSAVDYSSTAAGRLPQIVTPPVPHEQTVGRSSGAIREQRIAGDRAEEIDAVPAAALRRLGPRLIVSAMAKVVDAPTRFTRISKS